MSKEEFNDKSRSLLDEHVDALDAATLSKLHQARTRAVAARRSRVPAYAGWAGGALAASITLAVINFEQGPPPLPSIYEDPLQQAAAEELEFVDDLEFIAWLILEEEETNDVVEST
jgi:hypothetical protein